MRPKEGRGWLRENTGLVVGSLWYEHDAQRAIEPGGQFLPAGAPSLS